MTGMRRTRAAPSTTSFWRSASSHVGVESQAWWPPSISTTSPMSPRDIEVDPTVSLSPHCLTSRLGQPAGPAEPSEVELSEGGTPSHTSRMTAWMNARRRLRVDGEPVVEQSTRRGTVVVARRGSNDERRLTVAPGPLGGMDDGYLRSDPRHPDREAGAEVAPATQSHTGAGRDSRLRAGGPRRSPRAADRSGRRDSTRRRRRGRHLNPTPTRLARAAPHRQAARCR